MEMQPINPNKILGRLQAGTLVRHEWGDGRKRACLLAALAPQCAKAEAAHACPASVMPLWLAEITPMMDDKGTDEAWEPMVRRYAAVAARWYKLDAAGWRRALLGSLVAILEFVRERDRLDSYYTVLALCREGASADDSRWVAAAWAAETELQSSPWVTKVTRAAVSAAMVKDAGAMMRAAIATAGAARSAAVEAALMRAPVEEATKTADATKKMTWDRMTAGILSAIEVECNRSEMA